MEPVKVIPCLDMKDGRVVKGVHFVDLKDAGDPVQCARAYNEAGADEIAMLDICATVESRPTMLNVVRRVADAVTVPFVVGGGIGSLEDIEAVLDAGATRASISSAAFRKPELIAEAAGEFGSDCIVLAIDADANEKMPSGYEVYIDGGRTATGVDAVEFARRMASSGAGFMLPTSKATDGTLGGYDLKLTAAIADATGLPVIASGGAGKLDDFVDAVKIGHASAVLAASVFHFGTFTIPQVKMHLKAAGIAVNE